MKRKYVIGTRGSRLALWQAYEAKRSIETACGVEVEVKVISTKGDERLDIALHSNTLSKGLFTQELEEQLVTHDIDFAVHSLKDLPVDMDDRLCLAAVMERDDPRDVVIANFEVKDIKDLRGKRIGTSSPRRVAQLIKALGDEATGTSFGPIRGNVETRISKLRNGEYDAIIMAAAGIKRLGLEHEISYYISPEVIAPAPGQASVAIQCAKDNEEACAIAREVDHLVSHQMTHYERQLLNRLGGGCAIPFGALCTLEGNVVKGTAFFAFGEGMVGMRHDFSAEYPLHDDFITEIAETLKRP
ncbi:hydroxymethylbilane synthase [Porphyromonas cangingivalis]|uniref:hydroxymethylbilane synthase n=1 Tax=Porphyromonas cangingivalis TaxID=36874 RepID=UPI002430C3E5|nr:hydroxymethylbilane synthase [Porphyromonas cangingivalis]